MRIMDSTMINLDEVSPFPPVGTRCFYQNPALQLEGWGELVLPEKSGDDEEIPCLVPWRGNLTGPTSHEQAALSAIAPWIGVLPGDGYRMVPAFLLWMEKPTSDEQAP